MRILLATDGSSNARDAACALATLPLPAGTRIVLVTVFPVGRDEDGERQFAPVREAVRELPVEIVTEVRHGVPADEILHAEDAHHPDLVVLGSRGMSKVARFWMGSVAERVAQYSRAPVLLVWPGHCAFRKVLVGLDRSPIDERIGAWLKQVPLPSTAEVHLATFVTMMDVFARWRRTWLPPAPFILRLVERSVCADARRRLEAWRERYLPSGCTFRTHVRLGNPAEGLLQIAEEISADLVVVGSHGRGPLALLLLSSVSDQVLADTPCSLLIVKPSKQ